MVGKSLREPLRCPIIESMNDNAPNRARGCEHGRSAIAEGYGSYSGEVRICAGDAWDMGWIQNGWPPEFSNRPGAVNAPGDRPFNRWFSGPPDAGLLVDCECACVCSWNGPFGAVSAAQGVLRCPRCQEEGHPPAGRWKADIMNALPTDLRW
jgi:hypothetical protein